MKPYSNHFVPAFVFVCATAITLDVSAQNACPGEGSSANECRQPASLFPRQIGNTSVSWRTTTGRTGKITLEQDPIADFTWVHRTETNRVNTNDRLWMERSFDCGQTWQTACAERSGLSSAGILNKRFLVRGVFRAGDTGEVWRTPAYFEKCDGEHLEAGESCEPRVTPPPPPPPPPPGEKVGHLKVLNSDMCLVARSGAGERPVVQVSCAGYSDQDWIIRYLPGYTGPEGIAQIVNRDRNLCLVTRQVNVESKAVVSTCNTAWADQLWDVIRDANTGYYQLRNRNSQLCLVVRTNQAETQAIQSTCGTQWADQLWIWEGWFR